MAGALRPEDHERAQDVIDGWPVCITSYTIGTRHLCKIDNVDPGALIARGEGPTREAAEAEARARAREKLAATQRMKDSLRELHETVAQLDDRLRASKRNPGTSG